MGQGIVSIKRLAMPVLAMVLVLAGASPRALTAGVEAAGTAPMFFAATKLAVTISPLSAVPPVAPLATSTFNVTVTAEDASSNQANVAANTNITLSRIGGTGTLLGTLTGTILAGTSSFTFTGLSYQKAESGVTIRATRTSGDSLSAGTSAAFTVWPGPAVALDINTGDVNGGANPVAGTGFSVKVTAEDAVGNASDVTQATAVALSLSAGNGTLAGTLTGTILSGRTMTISGVTYTKAESNVVIRAARTSGDSLAAGTSDALTVNAGVASKLAVTSVNGAVPPAAGTAVAGTAFAVVVQSQDANGNPSFPIASTAIALTVTTGSGTLGGTTTGSIPTSGSPSVSLSVTYTKSGEAAVVLTATRTSGGNGLSAGASVPFTVTPGAATQLVFSAQSPTNVVSMTPINTPTGVKVDVRDANNNVVTTDTRTVTLAIGFNPSSGTLGGTKSTSAINGVAVFTTLTIDKIGSGYTLTASSIPALTTPTSTAFNITTGPAAKLAITSINGGSNPTAGANFSVVVQAQDLGGNPQNVTGTTGVVLTIGTGTPGSLGLNVTGSINSGGSAVTINNVTYTKAEAATLVASTTSGPTLNAGTSASFTVIAATVNKLAVIAVNGGGNPVAGATFAVTVQSQDLFGNPANETGLTNIGLSTATGSGTLSGTTTGTIANGQNTATGFAALTYNVAEGGVSLLAHRSSGGTAVLDGTSTSFTVDPGPASTLAFSAQPTNTQSATPINAGTGIKVEIRDALNNLVTNDVARNVTLAIGTNTGGGTLSGTVTVAAVSGVATFTAAQIDKIGIGYTLVASSSPALTTPTSSAFNITIGPVSQLGITSVSSGSNPTAGVAFSVGVQSQDAGGNPVNLGSPTLVTLSAPGFTGTVGGSQLGNTISSGTSSTTITGVTYTKAETLTITASASGGVSLASGVSSPFTVDPNTATKLVITSVNGGGNPVAGAAFSIVVQTQDVFSNAAPVTSSSNVTLSRSAGTGTLGPNPALQGTIANGTSAVTFAGLTYTKAESGVQVTATQTSGTPSVSAGVSGSLTVAAGAPAQLVFAAAPGNTQSATAINGGSGIVVQVQDANGNLVTTDTSSVSLAIGANPGGGALNPAAPTVAAIGGVATFTGVSINRIGTGYTLKAADGLLTQPTSVPFNITLGPVTQLGISSVNSGVNPTAGTAFAVVVQSQDAGGNPVNLTSDVGFTLGVGTGTGTLGGTLAGTITGGGSATTMTGLTYTKAESPVTLVATQTSGTPALTSAPSASFTVISGLATQFAVTTINGGVLNPVETIAFPVVVQAQDANGNPANVAATTAFSLSRAAGTATLGGVVAGTITSGTNTVNVSGVTYSKGESGVMIAATRTSGDALATGTSAAFTVNAFATAGAEMIQNGDFANGTTSWQFFEVPDIVSSVAGGVFQFVKANPTTTLSGVASVYQETTRALASGAPVLAQFDLGNSTTVRKRISIVMADADMTDLAACSFELAAGAPIRTYKMLTHTTRLVTNASIRFYAEDGGANGGNYLLDNVSMKYVPTQSALWTACVDPTRPSSPSGTDSATNLLTNGDFGTGTLAAWSVAGNVSLQLTSGVLEFIRPSASTPAGVVFQGTDLVSQSTGLAMTAGQIFTSTIQLGNNSSVRKRVTVRIGEADLSDQVACTFWVPPSQALLNYTIRGFASTAWTNATLSVYPETAGSETWIQFDNATLRRTGNYPVAGIECIEPVPGVVGGVAVQGDGSGGGGVGGSGGTGDASIDTLDSRAAGWMGTGGFGLSAEASYTGDAPGWRAEAWTTGRATLVWAEPLDLGTASAAHLTFASWLSSRPGSGSSGTVQVSTDGITWQNVATVPGTDGWARIDVDLSPFVGSPIFVRFIYDAVGPGQGVMPDIWRIDDVSVEIWYGH